MPTIRWMDSFQHRVSAIDGPWYTVTNGGTIPNHGGGQITFDTGVTRTSDHVCSVKIAEDGVAATGIQFVGLTNANVINLTTTVAVISFYIRVASAPATTSLFFRHAVAGTLCELSVDTSGNVTSRVATGTIRTGPTIADGLWHRIDLKFDVTTTTGTLDVQVDGVALTQATGTVTVVNLTSFALGSGTAAHNLTFWASDYVVSGTAADYPIGDHFVGYTTIRGDGTHNLGSSTFQGQDGGTSNFYTYVNDPWTDTTPVLSQDGSQGTDTYVRQLTAIDTTAYLEFTINEPTKPFGITTIWNVQPRLLWAALDSATADAQAMLLRYAGVDYCASPQIDASGNLARYFGHQGPDQGTIPSGGWTATKVGNATLRWGFSGDISPNPILNAAMIEYAAPWTVGATPPPPKIPLVQNVNHLSPI